MPDPDARIAELEAEVSRLREENVWLHKQRKVLKSLACAKPPDWEAYLPPVTEDEIYEALHGPRGKSLDELLAEFERNATEAGDTHGKSLSHPDDGDPPTTLTSGG